MSRPAQAVPRAVAFVRVLVLAQVAVGIAVIPIAAYYAHRAWHTADGSTPSEDRQFTAFGYGILAGLALVIAVLLAAASRRWGSGGGRGRAPLWVGELGMLFLSIATGDAIRGPYDRHNGYTALAEFTALSAVVVLVAANLPRSRAWARRPDADGAGLSRPVANR